MARFYISTPIYYVNDYPHIGHTYCTVCADAFARYHRLLGDDTFFLTGTDEHGQKVEKTAAKRGIEPQALADDVVNRYHELWKAMEITHDDFIRTTEERHKRGVLAVLKRIQDAGDIYKASYSGPYCVSCESFFPEGQVVDGKCPDFGHPVEILEEESYFFRLSKYQQPLLDLYESQPDFVMPETRMNEVRSFVEGGLRDLSVSRTSVNWGIRFPGDEKHVLYVWLDALSNYITALGFGSDNDDRYQKYWPADVHLIGKDILRFHAVYWPAFLMSAGLPLPKHVFGHGWWMKDAHKMSKSLGNIVDPRPFIEEFGPDAMRYFLLREKPIGTDGSFSDEGFLDRINADLANDLGNLVSRLTNLIERQAGGAIGPGDGSLRERGEAAMAEYRSWMDRLSPRDALIALWALVSHCNKYLVEHQPWANPGTEKSLTALSEGARALRMVALCIMPIMPKAAGAITDALGFDATDFVAWSWDVPQARPCKRPDQLFPRVDKKAYFDDLADPSKKEEPAVEKSEKKAEAPVAPPKKTEPGKITFDDFKRLELRAAKILEAERIPKSSKLLRIQVDLGTEKRQLVAGIAKKYEPEFLVGKTVPIVANLEPAKLMGVESNGMILAGNLDGEPILLQFLEDVPPGSRIS